MPRERRPGRSRRRGLHHLDKIRHRSLAAVHLLERDLPTLREAAPSAIRLFSLLWQLVPYRTILMVVGNLVKSLLPAVDLDLRARLLDLVAATVQRKSPFEAARAIKLLAYQLGSLLLRTGIEELLVRNGQVVNLTVARRLRHDLLRVHLQLDLAALEDQEIRQVLADGVPLSQPGFVGSLVWSVFNVTNAAVDITARIYAASRTLSWQALPYFGLYSVEPITRILVGRFRRPRENPERDEVRQRRADLDHVALSTSYRRDVALYGIEDWLLEEHDATEEHLDAIERQDDLTEAIRSRTTTGIVLPWTRSLVYAVLAWRAHLSAVSLSDLHLIEGATNQLVTTAHSAYHTQVDSWQLLHNLVSYYRAIELRPKLADGSREFSPDGPVKLELRNVSFSYGSNHVLRRVSFVVKPGESVALVGHNGAGKSTLLKLLARVYDPSEGQILLDGVDIREYDRASLRRGLAFAFHDFAKFPFTAGENVAVGDVAAAEDEVRDAAQRAGAEFIGDLWDKRLSPLSVEVVDAVDALSALRQSGSPGTDLSAGEWTKVALARVFLRDAPLVILDEPSAVLDPEAEHLLFDRLADDRHTLLFVTHRMNVVRAADRVVVLDDGTIIEDGKHEQLVDSNGLYSRFWSLYSGGF
ncbi:hypothetical protein PYCC9005_004737 [Savitreella phatthalungensis]